MGGCVGFVFPEELKDQPLQCFIASAASGPFQTSLASAKVGDILCFSKYLKFVLVSPNDEPARPQLDAFKL